MAFSLIVQDLLIRTAAQENKLNKNQSSPKSDDDSPSKNSTNKSLNNDKNNSKLNTKRKPILRLLHLILTVLYYIFVPFYIKRLLNIYIKRNQLKQNNEENKNCI